MEAQKSKKEQQENIDQEISKIPWKIPVSIAIGVLIAYGAFIIFMILKSNMGRGEVQWDRLLFLFSGIEAIVFTATGFIFGRDIHRNKAQAEEKRANEADEKRKEADDKKNEAEKKALEKEAEAKKQLERGQIVASILRSQSVSKTLGIMKAGDSSPETNGFMELLDEWYPKKK